MNISILTRPTWSALRITSSDLDRQADQMNRNFPQSIPGMTLSTDFIFSTTLIQFVAINQEPEAFNIRCHTIYVHRSGG
jgi:hypothetical protein